MITQSSPAAVNNGASIVAVKERAMQSVVIPKRTSSLDKFWLNCKPDENGCWIWQKSIKVTGYGNFCFGKNLNRDAHRVAYCLASGVECISRGLVVMHSCDVRACVNPAHLSLGTPRDNTHDCIRKGRAVYPGSPKGTRCLTKVQVRLAGIASIRGISQIEIARSFGVNQSSVCRAILREKAA